MNNWSKRRWSVFPWVTVFLWAATAVLYRITTHNIFDLISFGYSTAAVCLMPSLFSLFIVLLFRKRSADLKREMIVLLLLSAVFSVYWIIKSVERLPYYRETYEAGFLTKTTWKLLAFTTSAISIGSLMRVALLLGGIWRKSTGARKDERTKSHSSVPAVLLLLPALVCSGCSMRQASRDTAQSWAQSHAALLLRCGEELTANYPADPEWKRAEFEVSQISGDWIELWNAQSGEMINFHSESCQKVLEDASVGEVLLFRDGVRFSLGGNGFGAQTDYFDVYYIPSDDLTGCFGYHPDMTFTARNGGYLGRMPEKQDDNTFFYQKIGDHLYYCAAHY